MIDYLSALDNLKERGHDVFDSNTEQYRENKRMEDQ